MQTEAKENSQTVRNGSLTSLDKRKFLKKTSLFCAQGKIESHSGLE